ncbi:sporulation integral membrane protein YtvI [Oscillospiraceae bacterium LTW-04]|nr:sporulation integral membrane protein YtvI [Oscillospiraceae bacterium MB24-C1]
MEQQDKLNFIIRVLYCAIVAALCFLGLRFLLPWFWPFLFSLTLAYLFKHLATRFHARSKLASAAIGILFYATVVLLFWLLAGLAIGKLADIATDFPLYYADVLLPKAQRAGDRLLWLLQQLAPASVISVEGLFALISNATEDLVAGISNSLINMLTSFLKGLPLFIVGFVFMIISSFAIAMDYDRVTLFLLQQLPHRMRPMMLDIKNFLLSCLLRLARAYAIIMFITFCELSIGLWALRIERFWTIAAVIAVLDIMPLLGSGAVLIPWGIFELVNGRGPLGAGLLVLYAVIAVMRNIIEPHVVGDSLGLHPVITLTAMFFGLRTFGLFGMLAAPVAALLVRFLNSNGKIKLYRTE